ncbi:MAG: recombinase family protein [Deltaproteobacteria bacterium]|nr:recombinase family protein [Deltaproteobacteria bacterium]
METRAYGYIRVSGKGQIEGDGLVRQEQAIRDYAQAHGITIEKIFEDAGVSGTLEARPALAEMLVALEENGAEVQTIIFERVDRLARDLMIQERIISDLKTLEVSVISVVEGDDLFGDGDPTRTLVRQILGAIAQFDKQMVVLKLAAARARIRAKTGKCEGRKSYSEAQPEVVAEIKKLRRKQKGIADRMSFEEVARNLNARGIKTMTGKGWSGALVRNALK